ncbi:hypothetical protein LX16_2295 [Stackebrandtia albiflava]|uniref:Peptidoglycan binding protein n=1 Tax=Stackebrandtia albiflava TaxID=406432 RepID=A0A562V0X4_9ACTN|nr:hypothetical protein [Stackebrandtia albiflava]TWJ11570.1 hypothetical protein LX16_2295 [Stackebrandtia albiflava]
MRVTKGRIIGGAVTLVLVAGTATAWWVAADARTPAQQAAESTPPDESVITATVADRQLIDLLELDGELQRADELTVTAPGASGGESEGNSGQTLVSKLTTKAGDEVSAGKVLIELNGRPYLALEGAIPAYRDLTEGDQGPDVGQLQKALAPLFGTPVTGVFDARTAADVTRLYQNAGYQPLYTDAGESPEDGEGDGETGAKEPARLLTLPQSEVFFAADLPLTVGKVKAALAAPAEGELLTLVTGEWRVVVELDEQTAAELIRLKESTPFRFGEGPLAEQETAYPTIEEVKNEASGDEFYEGEQPQTVQRAVFEVTGDIEGEPGDPQRVIAEKLKSPEGSLVVPASAVWTSVDGAEKVTVYDGETFTDVPIETHVDYNGEIAVTPLEGELSEGDQVVVSKRDRGAE